MTAPSWFNQRVESIFGGKLGPANIVIDNPIPLRLRDDSGPMLLLPETASPSRPTWVEVDGFEKFDCPDCEGYGIQFYGGLTMQCDGCHGQRRFSVDEVLDIFSDPADFGVRRDDDGTIYKDISMEVK